MDDQKIIALYLARNEEAIAQTAASYGARLFILADHILESNQDAEESVNDTYWRVWNSIPPQRPNHFFAYLAKICRHLALNRVEWRNAAKRKAEIVSLTEEMAQCIPSQSRDTEPDSQALGTILDTFLRTLSKENRMIFLRRYWYADAIAEIAARYGTTEGAIQMRLNRTKAKLLRYLEREGIQV